jgi:hypothetical protein
MPFITKYLNFTDFVTGWPSFDSQKYVLNTIGLSNDLF